MYLGAGRASAAQSLAGVEIAVQHVTRPGPRWAAAARWSRHGR